MRIENVAPAWCTLGRIDETPGYDDDDKSGEVDEDGELTNDELGEP